MTITTWALVADRSEARILSSHRWPAELELIEEVRDPQGDLHDRDYKTSPQGRTFDRVGAARHTMERRELPHEHEAIAFARMLAEKLRDARIAGRFDRLVIAAEPRFLGLLRRELDDTTQRTVIGEVAKHLLGVGDGDLREQLAGATRGV